MLGREIAESNEDEAAVLNGELQSMKRRPNDLYERRIEAAWEDPERRYQRPDVLFEPYSGPDRPGGGLGLTKTSITTTAGLRTRFVKKTSASGTVSEEKPYPRVPLMKAANKPIPARPIGAASIGGIFAFGFPTGLL